MDDHVIEPPTVWTDRLPEKYLDVGPRFINDDLGGTWVFEDQKRPNGYTNLNGALRPSDRQPVWLAAGYDEMPPSCYDARARLEAMGDQVEAAVLFPNFPRFCGQVFLHAKDKELALLCVRAYNDWLVDEWCAVDRDRLIPLAMIPLWDPPAAAAELERMADKGVPGFTFSQAPHTHGLPSIHDRSGFWDPVMSVANDRDLVVCTHLGTVNGEIRNDRTAPDAPIGVTSLMEQFCGIETSLDWLYSGMFDRFPNLKVCLSESGVGWIPAVISLTEWCHEMTMGRNPIPGMKENETQRGVRKDDARSQWLLQQLEERAKTSRPPRELFMDHIYSCFIEEVHGREFWEEIGTDNAMIETDFPHAASRWPEALTYAKAAVAALDEEDQRKVLSENARKLFHIGSPEPP